MSRYLTRLSFRVWTGHVISSSNDLYGRNSTFVSLSVELYTEITDQSFVHQIFFHDIVITYLASAWTVLMSMPAWSVTVTPSSPWRSPSTKSERQHFRILMDTLGAYSCPKWTWPQAQGPEGGLDLSHVDWFLVHNPLHVEGQPSLFRIIFWNMGLINNHSHYCRVYVGVTF